MLPRLSSSPRPRDRSSLTPGAPASSKPPPSTSSPPSPAATSSNIASRKPPSIKPSPKNASPSMRGTFACLKDRGWGLRSTTTWLSGIGSNEFQTRHQPYRRFFMADPSGRSGRALCRPMARRPEPTAPAAISITRTEIVDVRSPLRPPHKWNRHEIDVKMVDKFWIG